MSASATAFNPAAGDFTKPVPDSIRVLTWNVRDQFIFNVAKDAAAKRVVETINPDIICFQEINGALAETNNQIGALVKARLDSYAPAYNWRVYVSGAPANGNKMVLCSRYPISVQANDTEPASDIRGMNMALVNLPDATYSKDLYVMNCHFKCCSDSIDDHRKRQRHADAVTNWMRDARTGGGNINLSAGTPMLLVGDTNLLNRGDMLPYHPAKTLIDGTIYHKGAYGQSSAPDWDGSHNTDAAPYDYSTGNPATHSNADPIARSDRFYYTDSVMRHVAGFIFNTMTMSPAALSAAGLQAGDSGVGDHIPTVADFALGPDPNAPGQLVINEILANDHLGDDRTFVEIKNVGGREINLDAPVDYWIKQGELMPASPPAAENEQDGYNLTGAIPAGGLFVLYDGAGESSAIRNQIESSLPRLQRNNISSFILDNDNNSALTLIEQTMSDWTVTFDTAVETYGWAVTSPITTRYFRTSSGNSLTIPITPDQWTTHNANATGVDTSLARNPGNTILDTYSSWSIGALPTPGQENLVPSQVKNWTLY